MVLLEVAVSGVLYLKPLLKQTSKHAFQRFFRVDLDSRLHGLIMFPLSCCQEGQPWKRWRALKCFSPVCIYEVFRLFIGRCLGFTPKQPTHRRPHMTEHGKTWQRCEFLPRKMMFLFNEITWVTMSCPHTTPPECRPKTHAHPHHLYLESRSHKYKAWEQASDNQCPMAKGRIEFVWYVFEELIELRFWHCWGMDHDFASATPPCLPTRHPQADEWTSEEAKKRAVFLSANVKA